jgi:hypothetical protein
VRKFSSPQAPFSDFSRAYENMRGENLTSTGPYTINVVFANQVCVSEVLIQQEAPGRSSSNVAQIEIVYKNFNDTNVRAPNGEILVLKSSRDTPRITENQPRCNIQGIDIRILSTSNNAFPYNVRAMVMGCSATRKLLADEEDCALWQ